MIILCAKIGADIGIFEKFFVLVIEIFLKKYYLSLIYIFIKGYFSEIGTITNVESIGKISHEHEVFFHTDCTSESMKPQGNLIHI